MFDNKSIVFGAIKHGGLKVRFHKDGAFRQAWYYDQNGLVQIIGWLEEGEIRSLESTGIVIYYEDKPKTKAEAIVAKAVENINAGYYDVVSDEEMERADAQIDEVKPEGATNG